MSVSIAAISLARAKTYASLAELAAVVVYQRKGDEVRLFYAIEMPWLT